MPFASRITPNDICADAIASLDSTSITSSEVEVALGQLNNGRSSGCGQLVAVIFCYARAEGPLTVQVHLLAPTLVALFSSAFISGVVLLSWRTSAVTPLCRKGDQTLTQNCRPVAVGVPLARLYATVLNRQLNAYLEEQNLHTKIKLVFEQVARSPTTYLHCSTPLTRIVGPNFIAVS